MEVRLLSDIYLQLIASGRDSRYVPEAYGFILSALDFERSRSAVEGHMDADTLVHAVVDLALLKFGPMAETVLTSWGIDNSRQIGEIVYNLISMEILTKQDGDRLEDFYAYGQLFAEVLEKKQYRVNRKQLHSFHDA